MCTFNRNNRECIHKLKSDKKFIDFTEEQDYYLCNDELNIAGIEEDDLAKFRVLVDGTFCDTERIYGFVKYIQNTNHTTFMICKHYDEDGNEFMLDYVYSSFYHAFKRLNHIGSFYNWTQLTNIRTVHMPKWFADYWLERNNKINKQFEDDVIEDEAEDVIEDIDYEDVTQYEQGQYDEEEREFKVKVLEQLNDIIDSFDNMSKNLDIHIKDIYSIYNRLLEKYNMLKSDNSDNVNKIKEQVSELSNRINIISKSVINTGSLNKIINQEQNKPAYSKTKYSNHVIC